MTEPNRRKLHQYEPRALRRGLGQKRPWLWDLGEDFEEATWWSLHELGWSGRMVEGFDASLMGGEL